MLLTLRALRRVLAVVCVVCASASAANADTPERMSTVGDRERINLTIYNGGSSLVHDRRRVRLRAGDNRIAWRDVSAQIDPTSAILTDLTVPGAAAVVEQNFDFDLLKPQALLDAYVGKRVTIVHDHPGNGKPARETATLLADNDGIVLQYPDRIETSLSDGRIVFPSLPTNLRDRPTLVLDVAADRTATQSIDLAYLTGGLGWEATYVGVVTSDERHMDLGGLITLTNQTGTTYENARVQLIAGNVHFEQRGAAGRPVESQTVDSYSLNGAPAVSQVNYFEYHLYTLAHPTTVANAQTKQVSFLSAKRVPIHKTLELRGSQSYYSNADADLGARLPIGVYLTFKNSGGDLGVPLPGGTVRLYKNDSHGTSQFLGSDAIDHTPRDRDVRLHVGDSFDVTAKKKQTDFQGLGKCTYESSYTVAISNAKDVAQDVLVVEPIPGTWSIVSENFPHQKTSSATASWTIHVLPGATRTLAYRAHVSLCF